MPFVTTLNLPGNSADYSETLQVNNPAEHECSTSTTEPTILTDDNGATHTALSNFTNLGQVDREQSEQAPAPLSPSLPDR